MGAVESLFKRADDGMQLKIMAKLNCFSQLNRTLRHMRGKTMLIYQSNPPVSHHRFSSESAMIGSANNSYTIIDQEDIRKKLIQLLKKNVSLSIPVPGKFATNTLLTTINSIENGHILLGGFQNEQANKELLMQDTLLVSAVFEGIAISFMLSDTVGMDIDASFNVKARLPKSMEWVQRRNFRRVKVPITSPVKIQYKNQAEYLNVSELSVAGLSYLTENKAQHFTMIGERRTDCNIVMPDNSVHLACFEIVNNITVFQKRSGYVNRVGCEIKHVSYRLDTALQRLINQIDTHYQ